MLDERLKLQQPCGFGSRGICCKTCLMGPCRIIDSVDKSVCGANKELIISRNVVRYAVGGASAHVGHASNLANYLGVNLKFGKNYLKQKAPKSVYKIWEKLDIIPEEPFKEIAEALHSTTFGVNADFKEIIKIALKLGIVDGYYGLYPATELEDKKYGKPKPKRGVVDLGVISKDKINIAVHGHEPMLAQALTKEIRKNNDINLVGVCCTGASLLAQHGIPLAAHVILQEDVVATGAIDALVVDVQCIMPSIADLVECYHTKLITTNKIARFPNAIHLPVKNNNGEEVAKKIIKIARDNKKNRGQIKLTDKKSEVSVGFTEDDFDPKEISDNIKDGRLKGVIAVIGCANPRVNDDWLSVYKKLSNDYLILTTGCMAFEFGRNGLLDGKKVFHLGSCVNNSRVAEIFKRIADAGKNDVTELPFIVSCPRPITEKAIAIGFFFASFGVDVHFGYPLILTDKKIQLFLTDTLKNIFKSRVFLESSPERFMKSI